MSSRRDTRGVGARGVVREIDEQLTRLDREETALAAERGRLLAAKAALTGKASAPTAGERRISQDDIAAYLREHQAPYRAQIAGRSGVPVTNISAHLYRAKGERFERRGDGWHLLSRAG